MRPRTACDRGMRGVSLVLSTLRRFRARHLPIGLMTATDWADDSAAPGVDALWLTAIEVMVRRGAIFSNTQTGQAAQIG